MYHTLTKEEIYTALDERHSPETQKLLSAGNVAIAGLGGLGSNVAYALARIGVGHLHLIDFDVVDITNLNRQQYFMEHIGMYKTDALKSLLHLQYSRCCNADKFLFYFPGYPEEFPGKPFALHQKAVHSRILR